MQVFRKGGVNKPASHKSLFTIHSARKSVSRKAISRRKGVVGVAVTRFTTCRFIAPLHLPSLSLFPSFSFSSSSTPSAAPAFLNYSSKGISGRALSSAIMRQRAVLEAARGREKEKKKERERERERERKSRAGKSGGAYANDLQLTDVGSGAKELEGPFRPPASRCSTFALWTN